MGGQKKNDGLESRFLVWLLSDLGAIGGTQKRQVCRGQQQVGLKLSVCQKAAELCGSEDQEGWWGWRSRLNLPMMEP